MYWGRWGGASVQLRAHPRAAAPHFCGQVIQEAVQLPLGMAGASFPERLWGAGQRIRAGQRAAQPCRSTPWSLRKAERRKPVRVPSLPPPLRYSLVGERG